MAKQLSMEEREIISQMTYAGESQSSIGQQLGRHRSTISRELKRTTDSYGYSPSLAHHYARLRRQMRWWGRRKMEQEFIVIKKGSGYFLKQSSLTPFFTRGNASQLQSVEQEI